MTILGGLLSSISHWVFWRWERRKGGGGKWVSMFCVEHFLKESNVMCLCSAIHVNSSVSLLMSLPNFEQAIWENFSYLVHPPLLAGVLNFRKWNDWTPAVTKQPSLTQCLYSQIDHRTCGVSLFMSDTNPELELYLTYSPSTKCSTQNSWRRSFSSSSFSSFSSSKNSMRYAWKKST